MTCSSRCELRPRPPRSTRAKPPAVTMCTVNEEEEGEQHREATGSDSAIGPSSRPLALSPATTTPTRPAIIDPVYRPSDPDQRPRAAVAASSSTPGGHTAMDRCLTQSPHPTPQWRMVLPYFRAIYDSAPVRAPPWKGGARADYDRRRSMAPGPGLWAMRPRVLAFGAATVRTPPKAAASQRIPASGGGGSAA